MLNMVCNSCVVYEAEGLVVSRFVSPEHGEIVIQSKDLETRYVEGDEYEVDPDDDEITSHVSASELAVAPEVAAEVAAELEADSEEEEAPVTSPERSKRTTRRRSGTK